VTHQGAARKAASVHLGNRETDSSPGQFPLPYSVRVRVRSKISRLRVRDSSVSIRVRFMAQVRGEMSREKCPTLREMHRFIN